MSIFFSKELDATDLMRGPSQHHDEPLRSIKVTLEDNVILKAKLSRYFEPNEPDWLKNHHQQSPAFEKYFMYTYIPGRAMYSSETTGPRNLHVDNFSRHLPIKAELRVNVGQTTEIFESEVFEVYNPLTLRRVPFQTAHGSAFGYIYIAIKRTRSIYVGYLHTHKGEHNPIEAYSADSDNDFF